MNKSKLEVISNEIQKYITEHGILFGSHKWGGFNKKSDYDFLLRDTDYEFSDLLYEGFSYELNNYREDDFKSCYGLSSTGETINIILFSSLKLFLVYKKSSEILYFLLSSNILSSSSIENKQDRVRIFERIKDIVKISKELL